MTTEADLYIMRNLTKVFIVAEDIDFGYRIKGVFLDLSKAENYADSLFKLSEYENSCPYPFTILEYIVNNE